MVKVEYEGVQKQDKRLEYLLAQVKEGVKLFVEAIRNSSEEHDGVGFNAFTLMSDNKKEADAVFDIMMTAVAIDLNEIASDLVAKYTFYHKVENEPSDLYYNLILMCDKKEPPSKEEIEKLIEAEKKLKEEAEKKLKEEAEASEDVGSMPHSTLSSEEDKEKKEEEAIPHASGIEYYRRPGGE